MHKTVKKRHRKIGHNYRKRAKSKLRRVSRAKLKSSRRRSR